MLTGKQRSEIIQNLMPYIKYGCLFRLVDQSDAEFIYVLRTDAVLSRFVSQVSGDVFVQKRWIIDYKKREAAGEDFYILSIDPETGSKQGVSRLYNFRNSVFELGSWLYLPQADISKSILGDIIAREIAYDILDFDVCTFEVRKANKSVIRYHQGYSPELTDEDEQNFYFRLSKETFNLHKNKFLNICGYGQHY
jgi:hypothetical protein